MRPNEQMIRTRRKKITDWMKMTILNFQGENTNTDHNYEMELSQILWSPKWNEQMKINKWKPNTDFNSTNNSAILKLNLFSAQKLGTYRIYLFSFFFPIFSALLRHFYVVLSSWFFFSLTKKATNVSAQWELNQQNRSFDLEL